MAMTFEQWRATRRQVADLDEWCGWPGYVYADGDYIVADLLGGLIVPITNTEARFDRLDDAERYLWDQWVKDEIGEAA